MTIPSDPEPLVAALVGPVATVTNRAKVIEAMPAGA
jgi:hypothetical protein